MHFEKKKIIQRIALKIWLFLNQSYLYLKWYMMIYPPKCLEIFIILINYELPSNYITSIFNIIRDTLALQSLTKFGLEKLI